MQARGGRALSIRHLPKGESDVTLAERLKDLRTSQGLSQKDLAHPRYTPAYVSTIEAGRRIPSRHALEHFAAKLGVDPEELLTGLSPELPAELRLRLHLARIAVSKGSVGEAEESYDEVLDQAARFELSEIQAAAIQGKALCAEFRGELRTAVELYERAEQVLESESPIARIDAVTGRARCLLLLGEVRHSLYLLEGMLERLERQELEEPSALVRLHTSLIATYFDMGLHEKAAASAEEALRLAPRVSEPHRLASMNVNVARVLLKQGRIDEATDTLRRAEDLFRQLNFKSEVGRAHLARGYVFARQGENESAREELGQAVTVFEEVDNKIDLARALNQLAHIERIEGNMDTAVAMLTRSLGLLSETHPAELALAHRELGLCMAEGDQQAAENELQRAIDFYKRAGQPVEIAATYRVLGDMARERGRIDEACEAYRKGILGMEERL